MGTSHFAEGRRQGYKWIDIVGETSRTRRARIWRCLAQPVHSDGPVDGKGGDVIVDLEVIEMKGMSSRRIADKNRIKAIPGRPANRTPVSNDVVSLAAFSMRATLPDEAVSL